MPRALSRPTTIGTGTRTFSSARGNGIHLYRNNGGHGFTDVSGSLGIGAGSDARLVHMNGDSWKDFVKLTRSEGTVRYSNKAGGSGRRR